MHRSAPGNIIHKHRLLFNSGKTKNIHFRIRQLKTLKKAVMECDEAIMKAVELDMKRHPAEAYVSEIGVLINEIDFALRNLKSWAKPRKVKTPLIRNFFGFSSHFPASSYLYPEPLGVVLIIGTWNYPIQFTLSPLVGAIAAGNCSVIKPSEVAHNSSAVIARIIREHFTDDHISVVEGGADTTQALLEEKFDHIFFTGGTRVGGIVMKAAAKHLTSLTLELGGKNPCIVDRDAHIEFTAKRIVYGKFMNAGQTCVAPDYLLAEKTIKKKLLEHIEKSIRDFYGDDPSQSPDYARIINDRHFHRLSLLLEEGEIVIGGETKAEERYIAPTVIDNVPLDAKIMEEEIFGPILPIIEYRDLSETISFIRERPKPLALYYFSRNRKNQEMVLRETSSGGGTINDTFMHILNPNLPFGGTGYSGMGKYHGKAGFDTFSNMKGVMKKSILFDIPFRYAPYRDKLKYLR